MYVRSLQLKCFRNYAHLELSLSPGIIVLIGDNAAGKSNIIETLYYLHTGKSEKALFEHEVIQWGTKEAQLIGEVVNQTGTHRLGIVISGEEDKQVELDHKPVRGLSQLRKTIPMLYLSNQDSELIKREPFIRRKFLNQVLLVIEGKYGYYLQKLKRIILSRNEVLRQIRDEGKSTDLIAVWNQGLIETSCYIAAKRRELIAKLQPIVQRLANELAPSQTLDLILEYRTNCPQGYLWDSTLQRLQAEEIKYAKTLIGPHRDDLDILLVKEQQKRPVRIYGSQGQQTTCAYLLKLSQAEIFHCEGVQHPVVLADDIFSELDRSLQRTVAGYLQKYEQVFIATTDTQIQEIFSVPITKYIVRNNTCLVER